MDYAPYTHKTPVLLKELAALKPKTLATMHESSFNGDCSQALMDLDAVMKEILGGDDMVQSNGQTSTSQSKEAV